MRRAGVAVGIVWGSVGSFQNCCSGVIFVGASVWGTGRAEEWWLGLRGRDSLDVFGAFWRAS